MTGLRDALHDVADGYAPIPAPPPGLYDRAKRQQLRRRLASGAAFVMAAITAGLLITIPVRPAHPVAPPSSPVRIPSHVVEAPQWTATVRDAPIGRALIAFTTQNHLDRIVLVGPDDQYRIQPVEPGGASNWEPTFLLAPNGRYLATTAEVVDLGSGESRRFGAGAPLAWSPDSTRIVLARFHPSDGWATITAVDVASGAEVWSFNLLTDSRNLAVALAHDGNAMAVQSGNYLYRYDSGQKAWGREIGDGLQLVGQLSWSPQDDRIALARVTQESVYRFVDPFDGTDLPETAGGPSFGYIEEQGRVHFAPAIVAWQDSVPIVNAGNRSIVRLQRLHQVIATLAEHTQEVQVAPEGLEWTPEIAGEPDPGPFLARYRPLMGLVGIGLGLLILLGILRAALRRRSH